MSSQDYPIDHFEQMARFAVILKALPAQILEHKYYYEVFGSWWLVFRVNGVVLRLAFEGKGFEYILDVSSSKQSPYQWEVFWQKSGIREVDLSSPEIMEAIQLAAKG